ncbi:hypothetical protein SAMN02745248_01511 [Hathewaya proteolytica DSM 3090]|uniref:Uncharacterized protein n=1 Tax=Hathewaya proteolytica DSM 3090 TaxID=1121331 RepID=A0A1M6NV46_9CLOT|nr:hypothetical protein [Hathewaya proteolytica]SHJ99586.1 hypothetical protein SAMN02745248_01511 [Hathewaya proteolytica DSM 3090]
MCEEYLFHGTERNRGLRFIKNKKMEESHGDSHWLGDGVYFYVQEFLAYNWIRKMFFHRIKKSFSYSELVNSYMILECKIKVDKKKVFNIVDNFEHQLIFEYFLDNVNSKKEYIEKYKDFDSLDGVVINCMFNELGYAQKFDIFVGAFVTKANRNRNKKN